MRGVRNARWVTAGLADQFVMACANAGNTLLALTLLSPHRGGIMILSVNLAYLVMYLNRAFVGDVLLALASRYDGARRDALVRNGLAAAVGIGAVAAMVLLAVWALWPNRGNIELPDLVWIAPFVPLLLLHDTGRFSYLANREPAKALKMDLVWVGTQAAAVAVMVLTGLISAGGLMVCWGVGAAAGAAFFLLSTGHRPWEGRPLRWVAETRHLSGWFTVTALVGQFQVQAIGFIVTGQLTPAAFAALRFGQTVLIQPVQNFLMAVQGLVVPRASRLAGDASRVAPDAAHRSGDNGSGAEAALRRLIRLLVLAFTGLAIVMIAVMWPLAQFGLVHIRKFADIASLALPMSLQAAIYMVQLPLTAALRAMHRARMLLVQYVVFTTVSLTGLVIGAHTAGLEGAAWGLTIGAAAGLVTMAALYGYALRFLGASEPERVDDEETAVPA